MINFKKEEFMCQCGCGVTAMDGDFLRMLDEARTIAGIPFRINSGYRCPAHNKAIGSTSTNHPSGAAADIYCVTGPDRDRILYALYMAGFRRIGLHEKFIHADNMDRRKAAPRSAWFY